MARGNNDLTLQVGFDIDRFNKELAKTNSSLTKWAGGVTSSLKGLAAGFSAIAIGRFVLDVSKLAGEAEGVSAAFNKLEGSAKLMTDLKKATGGTVSELELMKRSVMASNFDISLKALPQLLEFATLRARQTGQSVDYLVDSIVTGIGRKSKLILDNLGISAVQLTEALGGASAASSTIAEVAEAVGRISSSSLEKMGKLTDDAAVRSAVLAANWENLKVQIGEIVNNSGFSSFLKGLGDFVNLWNTAMGGKTSKPLENLASAIEIVNHALAKGDMETYNKFLKEAEELAKRTGKELVRMTDSVTGVTKVLVKTNPVTFIDGTKIKEEVRSVKFLEDTIAGLNEEIKMSGSRSQIAKYQAEIKAIQKEIDFLLGKVEKLDTDISFTGALNTPTGMEAVGKGTEVKLPILGPGDVDAMKKASEEIEATLDKLTQKHNEASEAWVQNQERIASSYALMGDSIGNAIGGLISGTENFAQTMAQAARQIVSNLERIALGYMIANAAKFGPIGIALAAAGFGVVKALFAQIGGGGSGGGGMGSGRNNRNFDGRQIVSQMGGNVTFTLRGQELQGVLDNYGRVKGRTGN